MATHTLTGSILALLAFLAVFAANSVTVRGYKVPGASFNITNEGAPGSFLGTGVKVQCYDVNGKVNLPVATLFPGQSLYQTWPLLSQWDAIYKCDFAVDAPPGTRTQSFPVWKHDLEVQGNTKNFLNQCTDCQWRIATEGIYWLFHCADGVVCGNAAWIKEHEWNSTRVQRSSVA